MARRIQLIMEYYPDNDPIEVSILRQQQQQWKKNQAKAMALVAIVYEKMIG